MFSSEGKLHVNFRALVDECHLDDSDFVMDENNENSGSKLAT